MKAEVWKTQLKTAVVRLKKDKRALLLLAAGLLLMLLLLLLPGGAKKVQTTDPPTADTPPQTQLCAELKTLLGQIRGAGETTVMLTFESGGETIYAADKDAAYAGGTDENDAKEKTSYVILKDGSRESGLRVKEIYPKVRGVAVVCEGGANAVVKAQVIRVVTALFDIKSTQVSVAEMAAKEEPT